MEKLDLRKENRHLYFAKLKPELLEVPELSYLVVDGKGDPGSSEFQGCIKALYGLAYTIKFDSKTADRDFKVMALEGRYCWQEGDPRSMEWSLMIMVPDFIRAKDVEKAREKAKRKGDEAFISRVRLERFPSGMAAQMLHVGPYDQEKKSVEVLMDFISSKGLRPDGRHHEIYISDPNRTAPEKLKTIIRYPIKEIAP
jgi:hypothetical protein